MSLAALSPNMSLPVPPVGVEPGPDYALDVNNALTIIDSHDHSLGNGAPVTPSGLLINAALTFNTNPVTALSYASFTALGSPSSVLQSLYVAPGTETPVLQDLWFTDSAGNQIQLTSNGLVNATIGSLPGESYSAGTFFWKQGTGSTTPANFDIGSIVLRPNIAATTFGITLTPPGAISSAWTMTLPADPSSAGGSNYLLMDTSGNVTGGALVDNSSIEFVSHVLRVKAGGITPAMIASGTLPYLKTVDFTVSGPFVVPANVTTILVEAIGAGGGGGGGGRNSLGGQGGSGSIPNFAVLKVTPGETLTVSIGSPGPGGAAQGTIGANGNPGTGGNASNINRSGTILLLALGGNGGLGSGNGYNASAWGARTAQIAGGHEGINGDPNAYNLGGSASAGTADAGGGGGAGAFNSTTIAIAGGNSGLGTGHSAGGVGYGAGGGGGQAGNGTGGNSGGAGGGGAAGLVRISYTSP